MVLYIFLGESCVRGTGFEGCTDEWYIAWLKEFSSGKIILHIYHSREEICVWYRGLANFYMLLKFKSSSHRQKAAVLSCSLHNP
jgi:hypothetical protein